jgi:hypothetical protein
MLNFKQVPADFKKIGTKTREDETYGTPSGTYFVLAGLQIRDKEQNTWILK